MKMRMSGKGAVIAALVIGAIFLTCLYFNDYVKDRVRFDRFSPSTVFVQNSADKDVYSHLDVLKLRMNQLSSSITDLWCSYKKLTYTGGFCLTADEIYMGGNHLWDLGLCKALEELIGKKSVGDLGAGIGPYGRCFLRREEPVFTLSTEDKTQKVNEEFLKVMGDYIKEPQKVHSWEGFDGAGSVELLSKGFVKQRDLSEIGLWLGRKYDWVISLEVGEHIPAVFEKIYMDNLVKHSCQGIAMSWAGPRQGGHHHVNEQPISLVKKKMTAYGMYNDEKAEMKLRKMSSLPWFKNNMLVFRFNNPTNCTVPLNWGN